MNAIKQQDAQKTKSKQKAEPEEDNWGQELATDMEKKTFKDLCEMLEVDYRQILKQVGVKGMMTKEQHGKALIILKEIEEGRK